MTTGRAFRVIALMAARDEADIISQVIADLVRQRVEVYLVDDGSTDGTVEEASAWLGRGLLKIERRPPTRYFEWSELLRRKQELAVTLSADWFLHQDADEFRESPWPHLDLHEAIRVVDELGYNAIDFRLLNFRPTQETAHLETDIRAALTHYEEPDVWDSMQIKAWKRSGTPVDLQSSGGHEAAFADRKIFPLKFLSRHYPIRGQAHGERKIFIERQPRYSPAELERGWHVQYAKAIPDSSFIRRSEELRHFDAATIRNELQSVPRDAQRIRELEGALSRLSSELAVLRSQLDASVLTNQRLSEELETARNDALRKARSAERRIVELVSSVHAVEERIGRERDVAIRGADELRRERDDLYASKSWRITRPLRWANTMVTGAAPPVHSPAPTNAGPPSVIQESSRLTPLSENWGIDRGTPVDRHYILAFLEDHRADIRGHVLEVKDSGYTQRFGGRAVTRSSVLDIDPANRKASVIGDLAGFPSDMDPVDCFILTQTLHIVFDIRTALRNAIGFLKPGGILLATVPAVSRVNGENGGLESGDFWRCTQAALRRLLGDVSEAADVEIITWGNVRTCTAFLYGLAAEELPQEALAFHDPWFPLLHGVRVVRR
jgi:hypothetical protein